MRGGEKGDVFAHPLFFAAFSSVCRQPAAPGPAAGGGGRPPPPNGGRGARTPQSNPPSSPGASAPPSPRPAGDGGSGIKNKHHPLPKTKPSLIKPQFLPHLQVSAVILLHGRFFLPAGFLLLFLRLGDTRGQPDARHRRRYSCAGGWQVSLGIWGGHPRVQKKGGGSPTSHPPAPRRPPSPAPPGPAPAPAPAGFGPPAVPPAFRGAACSRRSSRCGGKGWGGSGCGETPPLSPPKNGSQIGKTRFRPQKRG